jgi:hypothetical protein
VLCILTDLRRMIKNEQLGSIAIVLLSAFAPANAEEPDANGETDKHREMGLRVFGVGGWSGL